MEKHGRKIELCQHLTNPLGDPHFDFAKDVLVETILLEVENEVHWRLTEIPEKKHEEPKITEMIDARTGKPLGKRILIRLELRARGRMEQKGSDIFRDVSIDSNRI